MQFIDEVSVSLKAGNGGAGAVSFRREKFIPKGGPDGGNGGRGGSITIRASRHLNTLLDYKYKHAFSAMRGENGRGKNQEGKSGSDLVLNVPCGTVVRDGRTKRLVADLLRDGDEHVVVKGGMGGRGNAEFATATNQAPRFAQPGTAGEERDVVFELKLLADVGLVGFPNAGKSTLISVISAARPKIADYPFTTLVPNLGIVRYAEEKSFVVADIPGLIEGAHRGKGLGVQFLRHIERTRVLLFLIESTSPDPRRDFETLLNEIRLYNPRVARKKKLVAITKMDIAESKSAAKFKALKMGRGIPVHCISAATGQGIEKLLDELWRKLSMTARKSDRRSEG
ncbi:MAG TPA: GTPase ObgE [Bacteroidota bacterium]|nr:GTPase ObgE [Bacteroidota bacterium]